MSTMIVLLLVLVSAALNFALGVLVAAFFGHGPWRGSDTVRFLSDPYIPPPLFMRRRFVARSSTGASDSTSEGGGANASP